MLNCRLIARSASHGTRGKSAADARTGGVGRSRWLLSPATFRRHVDARIDRESTDAGAAAALAR